MNEEAGEETGRYSSPPDDRPTRLLQRWKDRARRLKTETYALYLAGRDPRVPWYGKALLALVVGYAFSPIDLIPDFIPVLGYLDDLVLVPLGIVLALKTVPPEVMEECRRRSVEQMAQGKPRNWVAAGVIVVVWLAALALAALWVTRVVRG